MEKPRIGGGFGAKQTAACDVYPAFVAMKTGRATGVWHRELPITPEKIAMSLMD